MINNFPFSMNLLVLNMCGMADYFILVKRFEDWDLSRPFWSFIKSLLQLV